MSTWDIKWNGKWRTFSVDDGYSDVLRREVNFETGEIVSYLGKQLQGRHVRHGSPDHKELMRMAKEIWSSQYD